MEREGDAPFGTRAHRLMSALTSGLAVLAFAVAITLAPARSGPGCQNDCIAFPFADASAYVPRDFWWMIFAFLLALVVPLMFATAGGRIVEARRVALQCAVLLATIAGTLLALAYSTQYLAIQASLAKDEREYLSLWSQYNPHGMFIALESIGLFITALALVAYGIALRPVDRSMRVVRALSLYGGGLAVVLLPAMLIVYRFDIEYWYEIYAITIVWTVLALVGGLNARHE